MNKFEKQVYQKVKNSSFLKDNYSYYKAKKYIKSLHRNLAKYHGFSGMSVNLKDKRNRNAGKIIL